ncbi:hypothetical protein CPC08DRAFT_753577 [Agrocybe pediades]|nr:hypothetical protein CPC08DRAFT_753577 [Agrocybe pediades]
MYYATFLEKTQFRTRFLRVRRESTQDIPAMPQNKCKKSTRHPVNSLFMNAHPSRFTPIAQKRVFHVKRRMAEKEKARPAPEKDALREVFTGFSGMEISSHPKHDTSICASFSDDLNLSLDSSDYESFDLSPRTVAGCGWTLFDIPSFPYE